MAIKAILDGSEWKLAGIVLWPGRVAHSSQPTDSVLAANAGSAAGTEKDGGPKPAGGEAAQPQPNNGPAAGPPANFLGPSFKRPKQSGLKPINPTSKPDADYVEVYFNQVLDTYRILPADALNLLDPEFKTWVAESSKDKAARELNLYEVFQFETLVVSVLPDEALRRRAWSVREKFRAAFPSDRYAAYINSKPPDVDQADTTLLRADIIRLIQEFHWLYNTTYVREKIRQKISINIALVAIAYVLVVVMFVIVNYDFQLHAFVPWAVNVLLAGVMGGIISTEFRLQNNPISSGEPIEELVQLNQGRYSVYIAPALGGVFAVVLFALIAGGLLTGNLFPTMVAYSPIAVDFWYETVPSSGIDAAKLLIWSFIAGFAERFVPDALDRVAAAGTPKDP